MTGGRRRRAGRQARLRRRCQLLGLGGCQGCGRKRDSEQEANLMDYRNFHVSSAVMQVWLEACLGLTSVTGQPGAEGGGAPVEVRAAGVERRCPRQRGAAAADLC